MKHLDLNFILCFTLIEPHAANTQSVGGKMNKVNEVKHMHLMGYFLFCCHAPFLSSGNPDSSFCRVSKPTAGLQLFLDVVYADITANKLAGVLFQSLVFCLHKMNHGLFCSGKKIRVHIPSWEEENILFLQLFAFFCSFFFFSVRFKKIAPER